MFNVLNTWEIDTVEEIGNYFNNFQLSGYRINGNEFVPIDEHNNKYQFVKQWIKNNKDKLIRINAKVPQEFQLRQLQQVVMDKTNEIKAFSINKPHLGKSKELIDNQLEIYEKLYEDAIANKPAFHKVLVGKHNKSKEIQHNNMLILNNIRRKLETRIKNNINIDDLINKLRQSTIDNLSILLKEIK